MAAGYAFVRKSVVKSVMASDSRELSSSISMGMIICDRSSFRSDICIMKGDVRTHSASSSNFVYKSTHRTSFEKIKPYTQKWEKSTMDTITELNLIAKKDSLMSMQLECDVQHEVPAVFFSTPGYTGNFFHEFNDGILPLYITSQHLSSKIVFVILDLHDWWLTKYGNILSQLSDYAMIDFDEDTRTHCFPEAIVGLRIHQELSINSSLMEGNKSIIDFRNLLDQAYLPRIHSLIREEEELHQLKKPTLAIMSRNGSRSIMNESFLVKMAVKIGFHVEILRPKRTTELAKIYRVLNSSDVMIGVHGAAMTHFLFMRPGSVFIQIIPIVTAWAAEEYYGAPAKKLGLKYIGYEILTTESSLYDKYELDDPVLADPTKVTEQGWQITKKIYLQCQTVRLDLIRFRKQLVEAYDYIIDRI
ncbi:xylan glycosyltransferase MUCI21-like [Malus domestica]|uniref:xylan glycosyltransferase MUCI21-like n=1 Tax=Malus domestica TaxID=3750 RepID=UPI003975E51F